MALQKATSSGSLLIKNKLNINFAAAGEHGHPRTTVIGIGERIKTGMHSRGNQ